MTTTLRDQSNGFTLIEIVMVLVILGILGGVASAKYFDMSESAQLQAAVSTVSNVQSRINSEFSARIVTGETCESSVLFVSNLSNLADEGTNQFGQFSLATSTGGETTGITSTGRRIYAKMSTDTSYFNTGTKLYVPTCANDVETRTFAQIVSDWIEDQITSLSKIENSAIDKNSDSDAISTEFTTADGTEVTVKFDPMLNITTPAPAYTKYQVTYSDGTQSFMLQIQEYEGQLVIRQAKVTDSSGKTTTIAISGDSAKRDPTSLSNAYDVAVNLGVDVSTYSALFNSGTASGSYSIGNTDFNGYEISITK